jgi:hypothetical protein
MLRLFALILFFPLSAQAFTWEKNDVPVKSEAGHWVSEWVEVEIPKGLVSFQVVAFGSPEARVQVTDLIDPEGEAYVTSGSSPLAKSDLPMLHNVKSPERSEGVVQGAGTLIYPNNPELPPPHAGKWRLRTLSLNGVKEPVEKTVDILVVGKDKVEKGSLPVHVWVSPGSYWAKKDGHLQGVLTAAGEMLATAGLELKVVAVDLLPEGPKKPMKVPEEMAVIARKTNDAEAVNLYFMPSMEYQSKPVNGLACLGGPIGLSRPHSCFASVYAAKGADQYSLDQQGKVVAHELCHYLGLFHTKDTGYMFIGDVFDALEDTHTDVDGSNLMDPGIPNQRPGLSPLQKKMLLFSPAIRKD